MIFIIYTTYLFEISKLNMYCTRAVLEYIWIFQRYKCQKPQIILI